MILKVEEPAELKADHLIWNPASQLIIPFAFFPEFSKEKCFVTKKQQTVDSCEVKIHL